MDLKRFFIAIFLIAIPLSNCFAKDFAVLQKEDFRHAKEFNQDGKSMVEAELGEDGKIKIEDLNKTALNQRVTIRIAGGEHRLVFRGPIHDKIVLGPFSQAEAEKIVAAVNGK